MVTSISKSQFKAKALEYLRLVEQSKRPLIITHDGKSVVRVIPFIDDHPQHTNVLQGTVITFNDPTEPISDTTWEALS